MVKDGLSQRWNCFFCYFNDTPHVLFCYLQLWMWNCNYCPQKKESYDFAKCWGVLWLLKDSNDRRKVTYLLFVCVVSQGNIVELQYFSCVGNCTWGGRLCKNIVRKSKTPVDSINYRWHNLRRHPRGVGTISTHNRSYQNVLKLSLVIDHSFNEVLHDKFSAHYIFEYFIYLLPFIF